MSNAEKVTAEKGIVKKVNVSAAFTDNARTRAILDGICVPRDVSFQVHCVGPGDLFARQLARAEFDVSELSVSSLAIATAGGDRTWVGLPVFTTHYFFHTMILVHADSDIHDPKQLRGKRVGVLEYQQTAVVWIRNVLQHQFGVAPTDMSWVMERRPDRSHGGKTGFVPPPGIDLQYVNEDRSLAAMVEAHEIDAILFYPEAEPGGIDDRPDGARARMRVRPLFDDPATEERRYYAATGIHPVNHGVVIRRTLAERHPWLVTSVYDALVAARDLVSNQETYPYGLNANRSTLEALLDGSFEQGLLPRRIAPDELFVEPIRS